MAEGIPSDRRLPIKMANSLQQAELISSDLKKASEARRILREAGWGGFAARLLAIILDWICASNRVPVRARDWVPPWVKE